MFRGEIDEVRIWDTVRKLSEIRDHRTADLSGVETGLVGYWKLNELSGNVQWTGRRVETTASFWAPHSVCARRAPGGHAEPGEGVVYDVVSSVADVVAILDGRT